MIMRVIMIVIKMVEKDNHYQESVMFCQSLNPSVLPSIGHTTSYRSSRMFWRANFAVTTSRLSFSPHTACRVSVGRGKGGL